MVCPGHLREILLELTNSNCTFYKKRWRLEQNHILNVIAWVYNESIHGNIKWEILLFVKALHVDLFFPPSAFLVQIGTPNILKTAALAGPWTGRNSVNTVWKNYSNQRDPERCLLNSFMWSRRGMASSQLSKRLGKKTIDFLQLSGMILPCFLFSAPWIQCHTSLQCDQIEHEY